MKQSLGLIEVTGLALAITVSDVMAKVASVQLLDIEKTNGSGWMLVKIAGDVASVNAAIATGADFAQQRNGLVAHKVIARPIDDLDRMLMQNSNNKAAQVNKAKAAAETVKPTSKASATDKTDVKPVKQAVSSSQVVTAKPVAAAKPITTKSITTKSITTKPVTTKPVAAKSVAAKSVATNKPAATKKPAAKTSTVTKAVADTTAVKTNQTPPVVSTPATAAVVASSVTATTTNIDQVKTTDSNKKLTS